MEGRAWSGGSTTSISDALGLSGGAVRLPKQRLKFIGEVEQLVQDMGGGDEGLMKSRRQPAQLMSFLHLPRWRRVCIDKSNKIRWG